MKLSNQLFRYFIFSFTAFIFSCSSPDTGEKEQSGLQFPKKRLAWEFERLKDPNTNEIPVNIRKREMLFAKTLNKSLKKSAAEQSYLHQGPYNVGGRTRAAAVDVSNPQLILAGGVSGGMWKSTNGGQSWYKTTSADQHHATSCLVQDTRPGKTNIWYYGSGEGVGNSATKSFSAIYTGNGVYKSTDNGENWVNLPATISPEPQTSTNWDFIWRLVTDPSTSDKDVVYAAIRNGIQKSEDGGQTWRQVLAGSTNTSYTDLAISSTGVLYATFSFDSGLNGVHRSTDGETWTRIDNGNFPSSTQRIVLAIDPNNENRVYFLAHTPGAGKVVQVFFDQTEGNSLLSYDYIGGDGSGSGGNWTNLSQNLPGNFDDFGNFNAQGSYNLTIAVQPGNSNIVIIGGTNLYRSTDAFTSENNTAWIGGYAINTNLPFFGVYPNHHPDQHWIQFAPDDPSKLYSFMDGGIAVTSNINSLNVAWTSLNNGYITSQFYTIALDHGNQQRMTVIGGLQDNGTYFTGSTNPEAHWVMSETGDGSYCAIADNGTNYYLSRQNGVVAKYILDASGNPIQFVRIDPAGGSNYSFINPFVLDPIDNNILYLAENNSIWRHPALNTISLTGSWQKLQSGWTKLTGRTNAQITAMKMGRNSSHRLYIGTSSRRIYRIDDVHQGEPDFVDITPNFANGNYTSDIAVDPNDDDRLIVVYSNYNVYSIYYSEDAGATWEGIGGNLEPELPAGLPPSLIGYGDGPSIRCAAIIPTGSRYVYLLGTSIGLFGTDLLDGDNTEWVLQGANSIGNVVVDKIDSRVSDGFTAIATHGLGVFTAFITDNEAISGRENVNSKNEFNWQIYPNPAISQIRLKGLENEKKSVKIFNANGILMHNVEPFSDNIPIDVSRLVSGTYYLQLEHASGVETKAFIKQ